MDKTLMIKWPTASVTFEYEMKGNQTPNRPFDVDMGHALAQGQRNQGQLEFTSSP